VRTRLEQGPIEVLLAADGPEAFRVLDRYPDVALIILDLMLPGMSGLEILSQLRADSPWKNVPCIVLTAAGQETQLREAEALGVAGVMTKPFSPRRLYERVLSLLHIGSPARPAPGANAPSFPS
jgi:two-component system, OmpR family, alkaline phosphatase synthesis response regulator PhoP